MRFSTRSKVSILFSLLALVALVASITAPQFATKSKAAHAASGSGSYAGKLGQTKVAATVNLSNVPTGKVAPTGKTSVIRPLGRPVAGIHAASAVSRPNGVSSNAGTGALLHNFIGVSALDNKAVTGGDLEPPDEGLGTGNGYVFNIVNNAGTIYKSNGSIVLGPFANYALFKELPTANLSDPRTYYDKSTNTWFATILGYTINPATGSFTESHVDIAVNPSGNPTTVWTVYRLDTTNNGSYGITDAGCPCLADYPIFGIDQYNIYLSTNEFTANGAGFNGAQVYALPKADLIHGTLANFVHYGNLSVAGVIAYHLQPATTYSNPNAEYFMNSLDPNNTFDNRLGVWALTNRDKIDKGVVPTLSARVVNSEAYAMPVNAQTPAGFNAGLKAPTTGVVTADFDAMQEVEYINGHLYGALNTSINVAGSSVALDGIAWFDVTPSLSGGTIGGSTHVAAQGYVSKIGEYLLYPHINVAANGTAAIVFSYGGPTTYLSAGYVTRSGSARGFGSIRTAAAGAAPDNGFTGTAAFGGVGRWGDYSAGELDPSGNGIWLATQYIAGTGDQFANWSNRVFEVAA